MAGSWLKGALAAAVLVGLQQVAAAEERTGPEDPTAPEGWTVPRTEWGDPDLRGTWPLDSVGRTPTERQPSLGAKAWLTDEEYSAALVEAEQVAQAYAR